MFESVMWNYIREERDILTNLLSENSVREGALRMKEAEVIYIVAHGSSCNAAVSIAPLISRLSGIRVYACTPSNFMHNAASLYAEPIDKTWILGISQTGTSRGVLEALDQVREIGFRTAGITNEAGSPIEQLSEITFPLMCGEEASNAKTKGYSATLLTLVLLGMELARVKQCLSAAELNEYYESLFHEISEIPSFVEQTVFWCVNHQYGRNMKSLYVIGSGMHFGTAMEGQLKMMETQCIPSMFNDLGEFSHGMHRALTTDSNVILINTEADRELCEATFIYLRKQSIPVLMINTLEPINADNVINVTPYPITSSIFLVTAVIQVLAAFVPELNGENPNRSRYNDYPEFVKTRV
ncbi:MAG: SIS domain-containing protein [Solobacterium sp.]|nr:SIS domain-containing protein [Solobacterium sp.]